jgi:hypothetical protein
MKKTYMIISAFTFIFSLLLVEKNESMALGESQQLLQIVDVMQNNGASVEEWYLYSREQLPSIRDFQTFKKTVDNYREKTGRFQWKINKEKDRWTAVGTYIDTENDYEEKIKLVTTLKNHDPLTYILFSVHGYGWNKKEWNSFMSSFQKTRNDIFRENPIFFTCVKGEISDNMESVLYNSVEKWLKNFQATPVEWLDEKTFVSVSAYTEQWENALPTDRDQINLQIALRKEGIGGKTTMVVGTPIITVEY